MLVRILKNKPNPTKWKNNTKIQLKKKYYTNGSTLQTAKLSPLEVQLRLVNILKTFPHIDFTKVKPTAHFYKDLDFDSVSRIELLMKIEDEFVIDIPYEDTFDLVSCDNVVEYITSHPLAK